MGIPVYVCYIADKSSEDPDQDAFHGGMGCHPTRAVALLRALTEAAQSRLTFISGARDDLTRAGYLTPPEPVFIDSIRGGSDAHGTPRSFGDAPDWQSDTLDGDVEWLLGRLARAGLERVIVVDLSKEGIEIPVTRVVIPGLRALPDVPSYLHRQHESRLRG